MAKNEVKRSAANINIDDHFCYPIAYIDASLMGKVEEELNKYPEFNQVTPMIPTVKILKKTFKGKQSFEEVPLLFNYGFFKMPRYKAVHYKFLDDLKNNISCIYAWVKDPQKEMNKHPIVREDGKSIYYTDAHIPIATATSLEVSTLISDSFKYSAHDSTDLGTVYPGMMVTLQGYPFDNMPAEIVEIDEKKKKVKVKLNIFSEIKEMSVEYENVFFTIYRRENHDDSITVKNSLDEMMDNNSFDKAQFRNRKTDD